MFENAVFDPKIELYAKSARGRRLFVIRLHLRATCLVAISASILPCYAALAGPCAKEIARLEASMNALAPNEKGGTAHQSRDAKLHRQPTLDTVAQGKDQATADERYDRALLSRARTLDKQGDEAGCKEVLTMVGRRELSR